MYKYVNSLINIYIHIYITKFIGSSLLRPSEDVSTQVDRLIHEAISNDNLCMSFVGWCPFWWYHYNIASFSWISESINRYFSRLSSLTISEHGSVACSSLIGSLIDSTSTPRTRTEACARNYQIICSIHLQQQRNYRLT